MKFEQIFFVVSFLNKILTEKPPKVEKKSLLKHYDL